MPDTQISEEMCLAAATSDAHFDGRSLESIGRIERERYLKRSRLALEAALSGHVVVPREPTRAMIDAATASTSGCGCADGEIGWLTP